MTPRQRFHERLNRAADKLKDNLICRRCSERFAFASMACRKAGIHQFVTLDEYHTEGDRLREQEGK